MDPQSRTAWIAASVAAGAVLIACLLGARSGAASSHTKEVRADALLRAAKQWTDAARSDDDPIARVLHAAYGAAYLHAARAIASDDELEGAAGVSVARMRTAADAQQRAAVRALTAAMAPQPLPESSQPDKPARMPAYRPR